MRWLWLEEPTPRDPWVNMARDTALLERMASNPSALPSVRIYRWDRPSVTIGRLQDEAAVRAEHGELPIVRRPTGGRAVLHGGGDLTISVVTRQEWLQKNADRSVLSSYRQIIGGLIDTLEALGILATLGSESLDSTGPTGINCFASVGKCDVTDRSTGQKIVGSAQRRVNGAILQQMTVPPRIIMDEVRFVHLLQGYLQKSLGVDDWNCVDTESVLCYTEHALSPTG